MISTDTNHPRIERFAMFNLSPKQLEQMGDFKRDELVEELLVKLRGSEPEHLPADDTAARVAIKKQVAVSDKWDMNNDLQVEKYVYLAFSYPVMLIDELPEAYVEILTWPDRDGNDKLDYLHDQLIRDHHVVDAEG